MNNPTQQFQARVYPTPTDITYVSLSWRKGQKLLTEKLTFEKQHETKEVTLSDGKEYIVSFSAKRKDKVRVSTFKDFRVDPCEVNLYIGESQ